MWQGRRKKCKEGWVWEKMLREEKERLNVSETAFLTRARFCSRLSTSFSTSTNDPCPNKRLNPFACQRWTLLYSLSLSFSTFSFFCLSQSLSYFFLLSHSILTFLFFCLSQSLSSFSYSPLSFSQIWISFSFQLCRSTLKTLSIFLFSLSVQITVRFHCQFSLSVFSQCHFSCPNFCLSVLSQVQ